jgi:uncharacterized OsmC-like protein
MSMINGIDAGALRETIAAVTADPALGMTRWRVANQWKGGTRSDGRVEGYEIGGKQVAKDFTIPIDEPFELCGSNQFPNPQEVLLAAFNACIMVGYVAVCSLEGIAIRSLRIETEGDIDLRGFLGIDPSVAPGYESLRYTVYLEADAGPEQLQKVHEVVCATAPNRHNLGRPVALETRFVAV